MLMRLFIFLYVGYFDEKQMWQQKTQFENKFIGDIVIWEEENLFMIEIINDNKQEFIYLSYFEMWFLIIVLCVFLIMLFSD